MVSLAWGVAPAYRRYAELKLKNDIGANLQKSRSVLTGCPPEVSVRKVGVDVVQVGTVEEVIKLEPKLQLNPLSDGCILQHGGVPLGKARPTELVIGFVALLPEGRVGKVGLGKQSLQVAVTTCAVVIARDVRIIQVVAICVEVAAAGGISGKAAVRIRNRIKRCIGGDVERRSRLQDACARKLPATCNAPEETCAMVEVRELIVAREGETVR